MAKHEFGMMQKDPKEKEQFDTYEPEKYNCIVIDDEDIELILMDLQSVHCYWHTLKRGKMGLAYYGITLIPPESMDGLMNILSSKNKEEYIALISLASQAKEHNKYMIHFGI